MHDRPTLPPEHGLAPAAGPAELGRPGDPGDPGAPRPSLGLDDPRALQILSTEHWSLLATRSLIWTESFARAGLFLSLLSASVVALSLIGTESDDFLTFALILLPVTLFTGIATFFRLDDANREEALWVAAMNRIRHAYVTIVPAVAERLIAGFTDDAMGIGRSYGLTGDVRYTIFHFFVTMPGMIAVVDAVIAAVIAGAALSKLGYGGMGVGAAAVLVGVVTAVLLGLRSQRTFNRYITSYRSRYPEPPPGVAMTEPDAFKRCDPQDAAEDLAGEPLARGVVGHDRVGHDGPDPERLDRRSERRVDRVEDERVDQPGISAGHPERPWLVAERGEHPVGRSLERLAADDPADRDDPGAAPAGARSSVMPGTARIGPIDTIGFDGATTIDVGRLDRGRDLGSRVGGLDPDERDLADVGRLAEADEVVLEVEPAVVGPDRVRTGSSVIGRIVARDARALAGGRAGPRSGGRRAGAGRSGRCGSRGRGRRAGTSPPRRTAPAHPSRPSCRRRDPSRLRVHRARRGCRGRCRGRGRRGGRGAPCRRRC